MAIRYSVTLKYSDYSDSHSNFEFQGKIKIIAVTYVWLYACIQQHQTKNLS